MPGCRKDNHLVNEFQLTSRPSEEAEERRTFDDSGVRGPEGQRGRGAREKRDIPRRELKRSP